MDVERRTAPPRSSSRVWYRIVLTPQQVAEGQGLVVRRLFGDAVGGLIDQQGIWLVADSHTDADVSETLFISPAAIAVVPHLIAQYGARPAAAPPRARATLLVGDDAAWDQLPYSAH